MNDPNIILLYVENPPKSEAFYAALLGKKAVESAPTFALFPLDNGFRLGLWIRSEVEPAVIAPSGGSELGFTLADNAAVDALYANWTASGIPIAQEPVTMDFGYTFVALDPDGHRLRVFALSA